MARKLGDVGKRAEQFRQVMRDKKFNIPSKAVELYPSLGPALKLKLLQFLAEYSYRRPTDGPADADPEALMPTDEKLEELLKEAMN